MSAGGLKLRLENGMVEYSSKKIAVDREPALYSSIAHQCGFDHEQCCSSGKNPIGGFN